MAVADKQLRHLFTITSGATPASGKTEYWDGDIQWATPEDVSTLDGYWLRGTRRTLTQAGYESCSTVVAPRSSIVLTKRAPIGQVAILGEPACCNQGCFLLTPKRDQDIRYYYYWLLIQADRLQALGRGSTFMELSTDELKSLRIPEPPLPRQRAIADFVDRETARIDGLIAAKKSVLGLLAEKRRAFITRAVTRGLDPNVPIRDSGIPWLGKIPAHWDVKRLKHLGNPIIGLTFDPADTVTNDRGVLVLRASNVKDKRIVLDDNIHVQMNIPPELITKVGDILICTRSGSRALIGKSAQIDEASAELTFGTFMTVFRSSCNDYLFLVFNSPLFDYQAGMYSTSTINQLTVETLKNLEVPIPPSSEQRAIVVHVRTETEKFDRITEHTNRTLSLLKERRSTLIAAAVAGKIDVEAAA